MKKSAIQLVSGKEIAEEDYTKIVKSRVSRFSHVKLEAGKNGLGLVMSPKVVAVCVSRPSKGFSPS